VLEDLLLENFWRDADTNRWREPTDKERDRMHDDRLLRILHDADRFVAGMLRRVRTDAERCEWIEVLFKACEAAGRLICESGLLRRNAIVDKNGRE
jgi:hypothetical protein